jgi:MerR family transcriptional regulator, light-induced transcriptional regulator
MGMSDVTLRMWQQRYGMEPSQRTAGGHRRSSGADLGRLAAVQRLMAHGMPTGDAARAVLAAARHGVPLGLAGPIAHQVCAAALDLNGPAVRELLRSHLRLGRVHGTWERVVRPVLGPVGDVWQRLPQGVAVEHLLTHVGAAVLGEATVRPAGAGRRPALLASVPDEPHDLPLAAARERGGRHARVPVVGHSRVSDRGRRSLPPRGPAPYGRAAGSSPEEAGR